MRKKIKDFLLKHRFWVMMILGMILFFITIRIGVWAYIFFYMVDPSGKLFIGSNLLMLFWWLWGVCYDIQDEAHYRHYVDRGGEDFEERYTKE